MKTLSLQVPDDTAQEIEALIAKRNLARARPRASQAAILREGLEQVLSAERGEKIETRFTNKDA